MYYLVEESFFYIFIYLFETAQIAIIYIGYYFLGSRIQYFCSFLINIIIYLPALAKKN